MYKQAMVQPLLNFDGKCEEALEFYRGALGAQLKLLMRFKDSPEPPPPGCAPPDASKVMHARFQIGDSVLLAADGRATGNPKFDGFSLSLAMENEADVDRAFNALADGGQVQMPLAKMFFSDRFGMVTDRFGVMWMVLVRPEENPAHRHQREDAESKGVLKNLPAIVQTYLNFDGKCEEAIELYRHALGAQIQMLARFKDSPEPPPAGCAPPDPNKIMHAQLQIGETVIMASDGRCQGNAKFGGVWLSLTMENEADVDRAFNALSEGGQVQMPLAKTFFSARFGMVNDRFGLMWIVLVRPEGSMEAGRN